MHLALLLCLFALPFSAHAQSDDTEYRGYYQKEAVFGTTVYIREAGLRNKPVLFLVHGLGDAASDDWLPTIPALIADYHIFAFDLPGFGHSTRGNHLYSPTNYARFLKAMADRLAPNQPLLLVGHSLGGGILLRFGDLYPERVRKLVLVDAAGILHRSSFARHAAMARRASSDSRSVAFAIDGASFNAWLGELIADSESFSLPVDEVLQSRPLRKMFLRGRAERIAALALLQENFTVAIAHQQAPVSILWGADDAVAPLRTGQLLAARLPQAHLEVIEGASHVPMKSHTQEFNRLLRQELTRSDYRRSDPPPSAVQPLGECRKQENVRFSGRYRRIVIRDCTQVVLEDVEAEEIEIVRSHVRMLRGRITAPSGAAMRLEQAKLMATATDIHGEVGIDASQSDLDLAGMRIESGREAIRSSDESRLLISVSHLRSSMGERDLHGAFRIAAQTPL